MRVPNFICIICLALILGSDAAAANAKEQLENSPRHGEWVKIPSTDGRSVDAFIVFPEIKEEATSVIVIHEIFGLTDWVRLVGDKLAEAGFVAICPDMLSGVEGGGTESFESGDDVRRAIRNLDSEQISADLKAAAKYLRDLPSTTDKVAVSGFCWGGGQTFRFAAHDDTIAGAFVFYGPPPSGEAIRDIKCPVYGFYGENDNRINATIERTKAAANAAGVSYEPVIYSGVGHGFLRHGMADDANDAAKATVEKAWKRFVDLLKGL